MANNRVLSQRCAASKLGEAESSPEAAKCGVAGHRSGAEHRDVVAALRSSGVLRSSSVRRSGAGRKVAAKKGGRVAKEVRRRALRAATASTSATRREAWKNPVFRYVQFY